MTDRPDSVMGLVELARRSFGQAGLANPAADARLLVGGLLRLSHGQIVAGHDAAVAAGDAQRVRAAIERRLRHEPVHRILGHRSFHDLDLRLSPATLEPRPDTEILVDHILPYLKTIIANKGNAQVLDLGTGTGAIALSLLKQCPEAVATGTDIAPEALVTAQQNAHLNGLSDRFSTVQSHWFVEIDGRFDIIVSNPPYIRTDVIKALAPDVRDFDPPAALDGGPDGLDAYRAIAAGAKDHLDDDGLVALEIGFDQKTDVAKIFQACGFSLLEAARDYGGNDRVLLFR
ncbi:peptide chain release factor N(5)-glutamine methyltransferase [Rhizobium sp. CG5]|uniref:peptide chain release factor N(5)-glutamine methyltransferase n=1 Tax=Rhizobium sp. CG5 TaxID=2726076 RepID=UPI002033F601|nr:peptide chain release factor N(5)-glutamine methyltransferase [Rhizobium sp. CG5]MCM2475171.1 peptide chain release factor N(5)-glutamine methyltransferase [Rhizobium sp. CG5]